jgi:hypothetical protein
MSEKVCKVQTNFTTTQTHTQLVKERDSYSSMETQSAIMLIQVSYRVLFLLLAEWQQNLSSSSLDS